MTKCLFFRKSAICMIKIKVTFQIASISWSEATFSTGIFNHVSYWISKGIHIIHIYFTLSSLVTDHSILDEREERFRCYFGLSWKSATLLCFQYNKLPIMHRTHAVILWVLLSLNDAKHGYLHYGLSTIQLQYFFP